MILNIMLNERHDGAFEAIIEVCYHFKMLYSNIRYA